MRSRFVPGVVAIVLLFASTARAQDIEVPVLTFDTSGDTVEESDDAIDLANLVQSAAKQVTTVQEAPSIVTILTEDELRDRSFRTLLEASEVVPGWMGVDAVHAFPFVLTRGVQQAVLTLQNGTSLFSTQDNAPTLWRVVPMENIKRIEMVTGPGGVLWGANAYLGILNVITKDAEDVDGVEAALGFGSGPGDPMVFRGYAMAGLPNLAGDTLKLFTHVSFESFEGARHVQPLNFFHSPPPQPNALTIWGGEIEADPRRGLIINFDGKLSFGDFALRWNYPWGDETRTLSVGGVVTREHLAEDNLPECTRIDRHDPTAGLPGDPCIDRGRVGRDNRWAYYDRFAVLEWNKRFANGAAGIHAKAYGIELTRNWAPLLVLPPSEGLLEGGLSVDADFTNYRVGGALDGDIQAGDTLQLLYGGEMFRSWIPDRTTLSRQGAGAEATFVAPYDLALLPLPCPLAATYDPNNGQVVLAADRFVRDCPLTAVFETDSTVVGAYAGARWRPTQRLALYGGARYQAAPASLSKRPYQLDRPLVTGALVYELVKDWHVKLNYAEGFRPPVFNNTDSNGESVNFAGERDLISETSKSAQVEINARLLRGVQNVRELNFRADYSYTKLDNLISFDENVYKNGASRVLHSAEFLSKLYLKGDHRFELAYTWLVTQAEDLGTLITMPEHWLAMSSILSVVPKHVEIHTTLRVNGAFEDPNRRIDTPGFTYDPVTGHAAQTVTVRANELVVDRIPASANLQVGARYTTSDKKVVVTATAYNSLNATNYQPEPLHAYSPRTTFYPAPFPRFRFFVTASYRY